MRKIFYRSGALLSRYYLPFIIVGFFLSLISFGMFKIHLKDQIKEGYAPDNAPSRDEAALMREFWNTTADPQMTVMLISAKNSTENMLDLGRLNAAVELSKYFLTVFECKLHPRGKSFKYSDLCKPYCEINVPLEYFVNQILNRAAISNNTSEPKKLTYPITTIEFSQQHSFNFHIERFLVDVKVSPAVNLTLPPIKPDVLVTNMESIGLVLLMFRADRSKEFVRKLTAWELAVFDHLENNFTNDLLDVQVIGSDILDREMLRDGIKTLPYFAGGFILMFIFVSANVFGTAYMQGKLDVGKILICAATIFCPILAITSTYGFISLIGLRINSFLLILPYLVLGIGVDDGFLLMHKWFQTTHIQNEDRMAFVMMEVGPSITVTTLTNVISFGIGAFTPTPEIRLFCFGMALALVFDYIFQIIIFCPILQLSAIFETHRELEDVKVSTEHEEGLPLNGNLTDAEDKGKNEPEKVEPQEAVKKEGGLSEKSSGQRRKSIGVKLWKSLDVYCHIISNRWFACALLCVTTVYLYFAIHGMLKIETRLDTRKILPRDSKLQHTNFLLDTKVWANNHQVQILISDPVNFTDPNEYKPFNQLLDDYESLPRSKGSNFSMVWLREYEKFIANEINENNEFNITSESSQQMLDLCRLDEFLNYKVGLFIPIHKFWENFIRVDRPNNGSDCPIVTKFYVILTYGGLGGWADRIELMQSWRAIAKNYSGRTNWRVSVHDHNAMFIDQMLSLKGTTIQSGLITFFCMIVVCAIFIHNPFSILVAACSILSISLGVFGYLSWSGFDLDPITMATLLISIGLSVDFTAHIAYHFGQDHHDVYQPDGQFVRIPLVDSYQKLRFTLASVGWPMIQSGLSTALCVSPLIFLNKYAPSVFVYSVFLACVFGLMHGLVLLPCFLSQVPSWCTSKSAFINKFPCLSRNKRTEVSTAKSPKSTPADEALT